MCQIQPCKLNAMLGPALGLELELREELVEAGEQRLEEARDRCEQRRVHADLHLQRLDATANLRNVVVVVGEVRDRGGDGE